MTTVTHIADTVTIGGDLYEHERSTLDTGNFITVDKPPFALWMMGISARIFGLNSWSLLVPQVLGAIRALCTNDRDLARALSAYGVTMGLAAVTGQFAGGALVQWSPFGLGWRTVFLLKLPVCIASRMRWSMNHAVFCVMPSARCIS